MTLAEKVERIQELAQEDGTVILLNKMVKCLVQNDGMTEDEALDFIIYNPVRSLAYMIEKAPIIMTPLED